MQDFTQNVSPDIKKTEISVLSLGIRAYGLQSSEELMGYLHHFSNHENSTIADLRLNVSKDGNLEWLNPGTGKIVKSEKVSPGSQVIITPEFSIDLAFKIRTE